MSKSRLPPVGFWSYARQDDELSSGKLSTLRSLLIHELQQLYGREPIRLFQDASTIAHGSAWEREIKKAINQSTFFIPIISPNFIQSEWCSREVELFLDREAELVTAYPDLPMRSRIFPILFIDIKDIDPENPPVLASLEALQWFDFRRLRHKSYDDEAVREALSELAFSMRDLLNVKVTTAVRGGQTASAPEAEAMEAERQAKVSLQEIQVRDMVDTAPEAETDAETRLESSVPSPAAKSADIARPIAVGDVLNHIFEVKRFIKAGGMGQVFEGLNVNSGERVAIKALLPALASDPKVIGLFQREAMTLTRLQHEALVQYRVLAKEPQLGALYIVTEYIDGGDLSEPLDRAGRTPEELKRLLARLASGLAAAHRLGAIHRDMSPDNVMLPDGDLHRAKIIDFGIAKDMGGNLPTLVGDGFAGKLAFVAPEQLGDHGGEVGTWTDVYSLALVILAVAKGAKSDMGGSFADAIAKRRGEVDVSAAPAELRALLSDMLRPDPAARIRTMDEVLARLAKGPTAVEAPPAPVVEPEAAAKVVDEGETGGAWRRGFWLPGGLVIAALAAVMAVWSLRKGQPESPAASPAPVAQAPAPKAPPREIDRTWIEGRRCLVNDRSGATTDVDLTIRLEGDRLVTHSGGVTDPPEAITAIGEGSITAGGATYTRSPDGNTITITGDSPGRLRRCGR